MLRNGAKTTDETARDDAGHGEGRGRGEVGEGYVLPGRKSSVERASEVLV